MRFDLEIQPISVALQFINAGSTIQTSVIPVLYLNTNEINITPADFVSIDTGSKIDTLLNLNIKQTLLDNEHSFSTESDQILVTHIAKYSKITGAKYPLFFKHKITLSAGTNISIQSIKIYNESGEILDDDQYIVEASTLEVYIYINPIINSFLMVEWADT